MQLHMQMTQGLCVTGHTPPLQPMRKRVHRCQDLLQAGGLVMMYTLPMQNRRFERFA